jgi:hypothetical protein
MVMDNYTEISQEAYDHALSLWDEAESLRPQIVSAKTLKEKLALQAERKSLLHKRNIVLGVAV